MQDSEVTVGLLVFMVNQRLHPILLNNVTVFRVQGNHPGKEILGNRFSPPPEKPSFSLYREFFINCLFQNHLAFRRRYAIF